MTFSIELARGVASIYHNDVDSENNLIESFSQICNFLADNPDRISWRTSKENPDIPSVYNENGLSKLASRYFLSYEKTVFPSAPSTTSDEMVSIVMQEAYGYSVEECNKIKISHQQSMSAENCVGALLERYLNSVLCSKGWYWCCGDFVKAIDFLTKDSTGKWFAIQIKNRDNSENSSSSAIRNGTSIEKWFRTFSKTGKTNWDNLPELMHGYELSEDGFIAFSRSYLQEAKENLATKQQKKN